ncbi:MAG: DUF1552 domain-containing protein [Bryobacteraceae bacterium]
MFRKHLSRRTLLRGAGTALALPFLDAMVPAFAGPARTRPQSRTRLAVVYVPNGVVMKHWTPAAAGADFALPRILQPLAPFRQDVIVLTGLAQNCGRSLGDGPGDHARAAASYLTGVHPKKTAGADIRNGISFDQIAAQSVGKASRFASLELGCEQTGFVGNCDSGYSCAYSNNLSWRSETAPLPPAVNPRLIFERLFGSQDGPMDPASRAKRRLYTDSILDLAQEDTRSIRRELGPTDQRKLDEYLFSVRDIERRIADAERAERERGTSEAPVNMEKPAGVPADFAEHARLMFDLMTAAFQADLTRIATIMLGREGSNRTYREIGIPEAHHGMTHHKGDEDKIEKITRVNEYHATQLAYFLGRLKSIPDGEGTLLDHSMILYGGGIGDGNRHDHHDLPALVAGHGAGTLSPGRHLIYPKETPMANLYVSLLERMDARQESVGDSSGKLEHLSEL